MRQNQKPIAGCRETLGMEGRIDLVLFDLDDVLYHYSRRRETGRPIRSPKAWR
jgi:hypothetical protein